MKKEILMINIKRLFFITIFFSWFFMPKSLMAQKINQFDNNNKRTGVWKKYYPNKRIRYVGEFENGKEIGVFKFYDVTTSDYPVIVKTYFEESDSIFVQFFSVKGKIQSEGIMNERKREGKWQYYFENGEVLSEEHYVNGKLNGESITYYPDGKIAEFSTYENGLKSGVNSKYSNAGILIEEVTFEHGSENGLAKYFDLEGNLKEKGTYNDGKRIGNWDYYIDGEVASDKDKKEARSKYKREN